MIATFLATGSLRIDKLVTRVRCLFQALPESGHYQHPQGARSGSRMVYGRPGRSGRAKLYCYLKDISVRSFILNGAPRPSGLAQWVRAKLPSVG